MIPNINNTIGLDNDYEIIVVNSGGTQISAIKELPMVHVYDTPREGAPQARNFGATKASKDVLLFADAHVEFRHKWGYKLLADLELNNKSLIAPCIAVMGGDDKSRACGFKWTNTAMEISWLPDLKPDIHEIPFASGCCILVEKKIFDEIGQFDSGIKFWGEEDSEISLRSWLMGFRVLCDPSIRVYHKFRTSFPYNVDWIDVYYNKIRTAFSHFSSKRLTAHLRAMYNDTYEFDKILLMNIEDKVLDRRRMLFNERTYTDDWFFEKFPMTG